jgi:hypothetical protein
MCLDLTNPANRTVAQKPARDAQQLGPAYAFQIPTADGQKIEGVIKRYQADFHSDSPFPEEIRTPLNTFLHSLIPAKMTIGVCEESDGDSEDEAHTTEPRRNGSNSFDKRKGTYGSHA